MNYILSIVLHILILLAISISLSWWTEENITFPETITATVMPSHPLIVKEEIIKKPSIIRKKLGATTTDTQSVTQTQKTIAEKSFSPLEKKELLLLLHHAIQNAQQYPETAIEQQYEGSVVVNFMLFPDGHINQLTIEKSSGINLLDNAALSSVEKAAPFQGTVRYVKQPQLFRVTVQFTLPHESF